MTKEWSAAITTARISSIRNMINGGLLSELEAILDRRTKTCVNCLHFQQDVEICSLAQVRPPAKIIAAGCEKHDEDIPF